MAKAIESYILSLAFFNQIQTDPDIRDRDMPLSCERRAIGIHGSMPRSLRVHPNFTADCKHQIVQNACGISCSGDLMQSNFARENLSLQTMDKAPPQFWLSG